MKLLSIVLVALILAGALSAGAAAPAYAGVVTQPHHDYHGHEMCFVGSDDNVPLTG